MSLTDASDYPGFQTTPEQIQQAEAFVASLMGRASPAAQNAAPFATPAEPLGLESYDVLWMQIRSSDRVVLPFGPLTSAPTVTIGGDVRTDISVYPWSVIFENLISSGYSVEVAGDTGWADRAALPPEVFEAITIALRNVILAPAGQMITGQRLGDWSETYSAGDGESPRRRIQGLLGPWVRPQSGFC